VARIWQRALRFTPLLIGVVALSAPGCLSATEAILELRTNVDCSIVRNRGVVLLVGRSAPEVKRQESVFRQIYFDDCIPGGSSDALNFLGSITLAPEETKDSVLVTAAIIGIDRKSEECKLQQVMQQQNNSPMNEAALAEKFPGCSYTWRSTRFLKRSKLTLKMVVYVECKDVACGPNEFCGAGAKCLPADQSAVDCARVEGCDGEPTSADSGVTLDARQDGTAPTDGSAGSTEGGANGEGGSNNDAGALDDAGPFNSTGTGPDQVECIDGSICKGATPFCCANNASPPGPVCGGQCDAPRSVVPIVIRCDGAEDCMPGYYCAIIPDGTTCITGEAGITFACYNDQDCPTDRARCVRTGPRLPNLGTCVK
jgi:hypothetical protein